MAKDDESPYPDPFTKLVEIYTYIYIEARKLFILSKSRQVVVGKLVAGELVKIIQERSHVTAKTYKISPGIRVGQWRTISES